MYDNFIDNVTKKQYELKVESAIARIEYIKAQDKIYLTHTEVPKNLNGKGLGSAIVELALKDVKSQKLTLIPLCPFVAMYIKRHPEWYVLVSPNINIK